MKHCPCLSGWLLLPLAAMAAFACKVDPDYDLENIDTTATVLKGLEVPVGSTKPIYLREFLKDAIEESEVIDTLTAETVTPGRKVGDVIIRFSAGEGIRFESEAIDLGLDDIDRDADTETFETDLAEPLQALIPAEYQQMPVSALPDEVKALGLAGSSVFPRTVDVEYDFPLYMDYDAFTEDVEQVYSADIAGLLSHTIRLAANLKDDSKVQVTLKKGFTVRFPEWVRLKAVRTDGFVLSFDQRTLVTSKDITTRALTLACDLEGLAIDRTKIAAHEQGVLTEADGRRHLYVTGDLGASGQVEVNCTGVVGDIPDSKKLVIDVQNNYKASGIKVESATLLLAADRLKSHLQLDEPQEIEVLEEEDLPDLLTDGDLSLQLPDAHIKFTVDNGLPLGFIFTADLTTTPLPFQQDRGTGTYTIPALQFPAGTSRSLCLNALVDGGRTADGFEYVRIDRLGSILDPLPARISVRPDLDLDNREVTIQPDRVYSFGLEDISVEAPLALSADSHISLRDTVSVGIDLSENHVTADEVEIHATVDNGIPFGFGVEAEVLLRTSREGVTPVTYEVSPFQVSVTDIEPGTRTEVVLTLKDTGATPTVLKVDDIAFTLKARGGDGSAVNVNQSLKIDNAWLHLKSGVTLDLDNMDR